jgi:hypothetical protein
MLQFLSVCAGAFALTATAQTVYVADNFEAEGSGLTNAAIGAAAGMYKANVWDFDAQTKLTNLVWNAGAGDASTIQAFDGTYANGRPITNANAQAQALKLETEGQTLTRYVAFTQDDGSSSGGVPLTTPASIDVTAVSPVYVDTLMKFTPSEDDPEVTDPNIKLALFVNVNSNLVLRHKYYDVNLLPNAGYVTTNSVFTDLGEINPEQWYRLTIKMQYNTGFGAMQAWLWLDGTPLTHYNGEVDENNLHGGPIFYTISDAQTLSQVSFQGTGYVDDLVVARDITSFAGQAGLTLTLAFDDAVLDVLVDGQPVQPNAVVESGSTLAITAVDWYQINSVTGDGITYTGTTGELEGESTGTITADGPDKTATINASQYTGSIPTGFPPGHPYETLPANKLAAWAVASGLTEQDVALNAEDYLDNYLLNIDESIAAQLQITSIVYDPGPPVEKATITVGATNPAVDFTKLNGTLVVQTTDDLATGFGATTEYAITLTAAGEVTIEVEAIAGNFIRAYVQ